MTKNIKLTSDYKLPKGKKCLGGYDFLNYPWPSLVEGEFWNPKKDLLNDPDNVPIYDTKECTNVIRTVAIECYSCNCSDESIEVPTAKADEFLAMKMDNKNIFEEVNV